MSYVLKGKVSQKITSLEKHGDYWSLYKIVNHEFKSCYKLRCFKFLRAFLRYLVYSNVLLNSELRKAYNCLAAVVSIGNSIQENQFTERTLWNIANKNLPPPPGIYIRRYLKIRCALAEFNRLLTKVICLHLQWSSKMRLFLISTKDIFIYYQI